MKGKLQACDFDEWPLSAPCSRWLTARGVWVKMPLFQPFDRRHASRHSFPAIGRPRCAIAGFQPQVCARTPANRSRGREAFVQDRVDGRAAVGPACRSDRHAAAVETREGEAFERFAEGSALV